MARLRRLVLVPAVAAGLVAAVAAPAAAAPLTPSRPTTLVIEDLTFPYGPCPDVTVSDFDIRLRIQTFSDGDRVVQEVRNVSYSGTLTGPTGTQTTYEGHFRVVDFYDEGVSVRQGLVGKAILPDGGELVLTAGRQVLDLGTQDVEVAAGNNTFEEFNVALCGALGAEPA
ncbi:hypothetical protein ACI780_18195 [Geodermatophilus sp. SYSU D00814]